MRRLSTPNRGTTLQATQCLVGTTRARVLNMRVTMALWAPGPLFPIFQGSNTCPTRLMSSHLSPELLPMNLEALFISMTPIPHMEGQHQDRLPVLGVWLAWGE